MRTTLSACLLLTFGAFTDNAAAMSPTSSWHYSTEIDDLSGKSFDLASLKSLNTNDLHSPYGAGIGATLFVRKHPKTGTNVFLSLDKGQIMCTSYQVCTIHARFDDGSPVALRALAPSDGSDDSVFIVDANAFVKKLKPAKQLVVEMTLFQDGDRIWKFDVSGMQWPRPKETSRAPSH